MSRPTVASVQRFAGGVHDEVVALRSQVKALEAALIILTADYLPDVDDVRTAEVIPFPERPTTGQKAAVARQGPATVIPLRRR